MGKEYKGLAMVREQKQYKTHMFTFDKGDYLVRIQGSQSLKSQRKLIKLDYLNQTTNLSFLRFITKNKKVYDIGRKDGRLLKIDIPKG
jgi:hypothetical protein